MLSLTLSGRMLVVHLGGAEETERRWAVVLASTANTKPTLIRRVLHHNLRVITQPPEH